MSFVLEFEFFRRAVCKKSLTYIVLLDSPSGPSEVVRVVRTLVSTLTEVQDDREPFQNCLLG